MGVTDDLSPWMDAAWARYAAIDAELERHLRAGDRGWLEVPDARWTGGLLVQDAFVWHPFPLEPTRTTHGGTASFYDITDPKTCDLALAAIDYRDGVRRAFGRKP